MQANFFWVFLSAVNSAWRGVQQLHQFSWRCCLLTTAPVACREDLLRRALGTTWDVLTSTEQPISAQIDQKVALALIPRLS